MATKIDTPLITSTQINASIVSLLVDGTYKDWLPKENMPIFGGLT